MSHAIGRTKGPSNTVRRGRPGGVTRFGPPVGFTRSSLLRTLALLVLLVHVPAFAQSFDETRYYQQCLRFEAGGDLETARQSCLNALQVKPGFVDADLALARIELKLGEFGAAESRLRRIRDKTEGAEALVLLARAVIEGDRPAEAEPLLQQARQRLQANPNRDMSGAVSFLEGKVAESRGLTNEALLAFQRAVDADGLNVDYRLADAHMRFRLGDLDSARDQLNAYMALSGDTRNADVRSLLGTILWANGDLSGATGELETALALRSSRQTAAQASDLRSLAIIYYAQGNVQAGGLALREAGRRGNLQSFLFSNALLWVLLFLVLVAAHLLAESRIPNTSTLEVIEGPQQWSVGQVYGVLFVSLLSAAAVALIYSLLIYNNLLAVITPIQGSNVRAVFLLVLTLMLAGLTWRRVARHGWDPVERLLGSGDQAMLGIGLGVLLLAATLAYVAYAPDHGILGPFYLDLTRLTPLVVAALVLLPLSELYFRAFLIPALRNRYDPGTAAFASASVYALVLVTPIPVLFLSGLLLSEVFRRRGSGMTPLIAQFVFGIGLVLLVAYSSGVRSLLLN